MNFLLQIIQTIGMAFIAMLKGIVKCLPSFLDMANSLNEIKSIFSLEGILQYGFGLPAIICTIIGLGVSSIPVLKRSLK